MSSYKCGKCIHEEACDQAKYDDYFGECKLYKDKSLFVELPCKVGDEVYIICMKHYCHACRIWSDNCHKNCLFKDDLKKSVVCKAKVFAILLGGIEGNNEICMEAEKTQFIHTHNITRLFEDFGKTVFLTKEEAERELERNAKNN